ncbi:MAG: signal peptidase I [Clostridia bacterium]|nr:signal peptidase I [Clostridia bacterium]
MKNIKSIYKIELLILFSIIILFFINDVKFKNLIAIITFGIILFGSLLYYGKKKDNNFFRWSATKIVVSVLICYYVITLILGIHLGFSKTFFSLKFENILMGIVPVLIINLICEYLKFVLIRNNFINKKAIYILTALMCIFNVIINLSSSINEGYEIFAFICMIVIPIIAQEILSTYLIFNYGFLPAIIYKLTMNLYLYLTPISTNLGDYLYSVVNIVIPYTIYVTLKKVLKKEDQKEKNKKKINEVSFSFLTIPTIILLFIMVILVSGITKYQMIAIASDSMFPSYQRGDAVIFEDVEVSNIKVGDILVFSNNNQVVTHRVAKIKESENKLYFYTKGDANNSLDVEPVKQENVLGIVRNGIKYIGYPTVIINEIIKGR